jgi:mannose-1-phosphate guanylyltransferase
MTVKGLVLAAGLGNRLRPITDRWPKPLVPFLCAHPLILALWRCQAAGITDIAVNTHHLAPQIAAFAKTKPFGLNLHVAHEPEILGTGGVYNPLRDWLGQDDLVVLNGDVVSDMPLTQLVEAHHRHKHAGALATMAVLDYVLPGEAGVHHKNKQIAGIGKQPVAGATAGNFACAQVLTPQFLDRLPRAGVFDVILQGYLPQLAAHTTFGVHVHAGYWHDLGNPPRFLAAVNEALALDDAAWAALGLPECHKALGRSPIRTRGRSLIDSGAQIGAGTTIGPGVVIESGATVGAGASLENTVLLPGSQVADGQRVQAQIVLSHPV